MPYSDNFFAALNAAVFSDGSFCYIPKGLRRPMELAPQRDAGRCFWLPLANACWSEGEKKHVVSIKGLSQDRVLYAAEAETSAIEIAREWVDSHVQNGSLD